MDRMQLKFVLTTSSPHSFFLHCTVFASQHIAAQLDNNNSDTAAVLWQAAVVQSGHYCTVLHYTVYNDSQIYDASSLFQKVKIILNESYQI